MKNFLYGILFCLVLFCASPAHAQTLTSGSSASGTIPTSPCTICYDTQTFSGNSGHGIMISVGDASGATTIKVFAPGGAQLGSTASNSFSYSPLPTTGTYTVQISGPYGSGYTAWYVAGDEGVSNGALTSGQTASATLSAGGLVSFTFSGTSTYGMQLRFAAASLAYDANIYVFKPDGTAWTNGLRAVTSTSLPSSGTYTVVVQGTTTTASGTFGLAYVIGKGATSGGNIGSGQFINDTLPAGLMTSYTFQGTSGAGVALSVGGLSFPVYIYIYKPDGTYWTYTSNDYFFTITTDPLPAGGTYTIVVVAQTYSNTGSYTLYFGQGADNVSEGWLVSGQTRTDGIMPLTGITSYKFEANASSSVSFTSSCTFSSVGCYMLVYKPDGSYWSYIPNSWSGSLPAVGGEYTLIVYEQSWTKTGNYSIGLTVTSPSPGASPSSNCPLCDELAALAATVESLLALPLDVGPAISPILGDAFGLPWGAPSGMGSSLSSTGNDLLPKNSTKTGYDLNVLEGE